MKTNKTFEIEVMRHNVTPAQFLAYLRQMQKKHPEMSSDFDLDYFAMKGNYSRYEQDSRYTDGTPDTKPCESEICKVKPYDHQTYIRNFDGTTYNEIIEFQFDDEKTGTGYYYTVQIDVEDEDRESNTRENLEKIATRHENHAKRNREKVAKIRAYLAEQGEWLSESYKNNQTWEADHLEREAAEAEALAEECREKAAPTAAQIVAAVTEKVEQTKTRSAWDRGVKEYAEELLEELAEAVEGGYVDESDLSNRRLFEKAMLNGAGSWAQFSDGGCSLCYDGQIAERLCAPWELRKTDHGRKDPNPRENWIAVQTRALYQAARLILAAAF